MSAEEETGVPQVSRFSKRGTPNCRPLSLHNRRVVNLAFDERKNGDGSGKASWCLHRQARTGVSVLHETLLFFSQQVPGFSVGAVEARS